MALSRDEEIISFEAVPEKYNVKQQRNALLEHVRTIHALAAQHVDYDYNWVPINHEAIVNLARHVQAVHLRVEELENALATGVWKRDPKLKPSLFQPADQLQILAVLKSTIAKYKNEFETYKVQVWEGFPETSDELKAVKQSVSNRLQEISDDVRSALKEFHGLADEWEKRLFLALDSQKERQQKEEQGCFAAVKGLFKR